MNILREFWYFLTDQEEPLEIKEVVEALWAKEKRPQMGKPKKTALGWEFNFTLPAGVSFRDFANKAEYFRDALGNVNVEVVRAGKQAKLKVITQQLKSKYLYDWNYDRKGALPIPIGHTHSELIVTDLADIPHMLIGGITGGGKSNSIHVIVNSLIHLEPGPQIILIDLKMSEYNYLENHCLLVTDHEGARQTLQRLVAEMRKRQQILKSSKCVNIAKYNQKNGPGALPYIVLVIDELAELTDEGAQNDVETLLRLCRSSGICIIAATQRPDAQTFKHFGQSKANFRARLCFAVADGINSKIILDTAHASELPDIPGRALWKLGKELIQIQTPYLDPEVAERELSSIGGKA